jgi:carboxylesterase type B
LQHGKFDRGISVMTGHNQDEGFRFVPNTLVTDDASYQKFVQSVIPSLADNPENLTYVTQTLYPPVFNGDQGYTTQTERSNLTVADAILVCNTRYMNQASFVPTTYAYEFSVSQAVHGADLAYIFYDSGAVDAINTTVATILQQYITRFAATGSPNGRGVPHFQPSSGLVVQNLGNDFVGPMQDESGVTQLPKRCQYWQDASYLSGHNG